MSLNSCLALRKRLLGLVLSLFLIATLLLVRYARLQIAESSYWSEKADRQHFLSIQEPFIRGALYSHPSLHPKHPNQAHILAWDVPRWHLYADPVALPAIYHAEISQILSLKLGLPPSHTNHILKQLSKQSRSRKLVTSLSSSSKSKLLSWWIPFARSKHLPSNSLFFMGDYKRTHPYDTLLGQVLQTVHHERDEKTGQATPTGGLELSLNPLLRGQKGMRRLMRSPKHHLETNSLITAPQHGSDVYLTIHHVLQAIAEEELQERVTALKAKSGWAVMMDPYTGAIWVLAQYPFFSPDHYSKSFQDPILRQSIPIKALTDANEPGSVMKPITVAIALMANEELAKRGEPPLFDPEEKMATRDGKFPGRKPLREITYHNFLNMDMAIQRSSNIYMARLAERIIHRLGAPWYRAMLEEQFGFGVKTGIELPGESSGMLPRIGKQYASGALEWSVPTPFSLAMGHNLQATSLQLLRAYAVLANGGTLVRPTCIHSVVKKGEKPLTSPISSSLLQKNLFPPSLHSSTIIKRVVRAMRYATKRGGSSWRGDVPGYKLAAKTGTAEKIVNGTYSRKDHVATFIGFMPADAPRFVLLVTVDEPEYGFVPGIGKVHMAGYSAAPLFQKIAARTLAYLGIEQDDPNNEDWKEEMRLLEQRYKAWNQVKP